MFSLSIEWRSSGIMAERDCSFLLRLPSVAQWHGASAASLSGPITLPTKVRLVKATVFPYGCENWTIKKAEC